MRVLRNSEPWQVSTNFIISEPDAHSCWRYNKASAALESAGGRITAGEAMDVLRSASQAGDYPTIWSAVYNLSTGEVSVVMGRDYRETHTFRLK
jgi:hypothetical protein